jgi:hypothetical protein
MEIQNYHHEDHQDIEETKGHLEINLTIFQVECGNLAKKSLHKFTITAFAASQRTFSK